MSDIELKIKRITIAAESRGIKVNEQRIRRKIRRLSKGDGQKVYDRISRCMVSFGDLRSHRINEVRHEARAMHLACNFLRGRDYRSIEPISRWDGMDGNRKMKWLPSFESQWKKLWERVRYHVERHLPAGEKNKGLDEFAAWEEDSRRYASNPDMQEPALAMARTRSIVAKTERRRAYEAQQKKAG